MSARLLMLTTTRNLEEMSSRQENRTVTEAINENTGSSQNMKLVLAQRNSDARL